MGVLVKLLRYLGTYCHSHMPAAELGGGLGSQSIIKFRVGYFQRRLAHWTLAPQLGVRYVPPGHYGGFF